MTPFVHAWMYRCDVDHRWNHAFVRLQKFKEGDRSEDHLAHLACNVAFLIWAVKKGVISQEDFTRSM
ncbi:MAG: hypothetical protein DMG26_21740 [Acidobacteria bacterium]|nr:MAG: hypothetical protein DMG26_21740 [Acidobacteriota bacterium]PYV23544.1 MAG: hypothetical protein DMG24_13685 [Acidobacteriota bacterium]